MFHVVVVGEKQKQGYDLRCHNPVFFIEERIIFFLYVCVLLQLNGTALFHYLPSQYTHQ